MKITRFILGSLAALGLMASLAPAIASAQFAGYCGNTYSGFGTTSTCTPGTLLVYVQVMNEYGSNRQSSDFTATVSAQNPSISSFPGSLSGTQITLTGSYTVNVLPIQGFTGNYSQGCTGNVVNGQQATCVVTENFSSPYFNSPTPYPYQYIPAQPLTCVPNYQTVTLGQSVSLNAEGGSYSQYNWQTPQREYLNVGATLNTVFSQTGTQNITVTNGTDTATCTVNVVAGPVPGYITPPGSNITPYSPGASYLPGTPYVVPTYVPSLPNTGLEPMSATQFAFAIVALIAFAMLSFPYARKALAAVRG